MGWGLGVEVIVDPVAANRRTSAGSFADGAANRWSIARQIAAFCSSAGRQAQLNRDFENAVMQAMLIENQVKE